VEKSIQKNLAVEAAQREYLMFADRASSDLLGATDDKIRQRSACEIGRALEQRFLAVRDPRFEPCGLGR